MNAIEKFYDLLERFIVKLHYKEKDSVGSTEAVKSCKL
jgi:hypothetical protein